MVGQKAKIGFASRAASAGESLRTAMGTTHPIADMKRVLALRPRGVSGLAVIGMPVGSPGMEVPGQSAQPFNVIAFGAERETIFARHGG